MALNHTRSGSERHPGISREKLKESWLVEFEWDTNKDASNTGKHGVTFSEAATVFGDPLELTIPDPDHSHDEFRWISLGRIERRGASVLHRRGGEPNSHHQCPPREPA